MVYFLKTRKGTMSIKEQDVDLILAKRIILRKYKIPYAHKYIDAIAKRLLYNSDGRERYTANPERLFYSYATMKNLLKCYFYDGTIYGLAKRSNNYNETLRYNNILPEAELFFSKSKSEIDFFNEHALGYYYKFITSIIEEVNQNTNMYLFENIIKEKAKEIQDIMRERNFNIFSNDKDLICVDTSVTEKVIKKAVELVYPDKNFDDVANKYKFDSFKATHIPGIQPDYISPIEPDEYNNYSDYCEEDLKELEREAYGYKEEDEEIKRGIYGYEEENEDEELENLREHREPNQFIVTMLRPGIINSTKPEDRVVVDLVHAGYIPNEELRKKCETEGVKYIKVLVEELQRKGKDWDFKWLSQIAFPEEAGKTPDVVASIDTPTESIAAVSPNAKDEIVVEKLDPSAEKGEPKSVEELIEVTRTEQGNVIYKNTQTGETIEQLAFDLGLPDDVMGDK